MDKTIIILNEFQYESSPFAHPYSESFFPHKCLCAFWDQYRCIFYDSIEKCHCVSVAIRILNAHYYCAYKTKISLALAASSSKASHNTHFHNMFYYNHTTVQHLHSENCIIDAPSLSLLFLLMTNYMMSVCVG